MNWIASFRNLPQAQNADYGFVMRELLEIPAQYSDERRAWLSRQRISEITQIQIHHDYIGSTPINPKKKAYFYVLDKERQPASIFSTKAYNTPEEAADAVKEILAIMQDFMQGKTIKVVVKPWKSKANQAA
jgi:hypothetical protein